MSIPSSPSKKVLRTPDHAFENLEDYNFQAHYMEIDDPDLGGLRLHYVDEGPRDGAVILLMHGEPSWSYLYRKMIPILGKAGFRVIAPDLIGFGKSDKPIERAAYSYAGHVTWIEQWLQKMDIQNITLFCQDWGGLIGLRLVADHEKLFARVAVGNTFLPTGSGQPSEAFLKWREFSQSISEFPTSAIIGGGVVQQMSKAGLAAYDAPYPDETYKSGARMFPVLVPIHETDPGAAENREAWKVLQKFDRPFLTLFSDQDPISKGGDELFQKLVPGATGQAHTLIKDAGHFLQEDKGPELAAHLIKFMT